MRSLLRALVIALCLFMALDMAASECSSCSYNARNCSDLLASSTSATDTDSESDTMDVCNIDGKIQIDDVFCDNDNCLCADTKQCVSLVIGCTNMFQARSRKRCVGNTTLETRFQKCAVAQNLTNLTESNLNADWIFFKNASKCLSDDCAIIRMFHQCNVVQCGYLLTTWKENNTYHFMVDGSRSSDMKAGTFHFQVPYNEATQDLTCKSATSTKVSSCYTLQTRNQPTGGVCDGVYLQYDTAVQFAHSDDYKLSTLSWPVWCAVVGSVAAAVVSIGAVGFVAYRFKHMDQTEENVNDELLGELDEVKNDEVDDQGGSSNAEEMSSPELRHRSSSPDIEDEENRHSVPV